MHPLSNEFERLAARMNIKENSSTFYSYPAEKFANGLVIKFVRFSSEYIQYEVGRKFLVIKSHRA